MLKFLLYALVLTFVVAFVALWMLLGDVTGAALSLAVLSLGVTLAVAIIGFLCSNVPSWIRSLRGISYNEYVDGLEARGQVSREDYTAIRALVAEDHTTSSLVYFVDIGEGRVLCLSGQQYFDYEPFDEVEALQNPRLFPTTQFSLRRRNSNGELVDVIPGSNVFEPIACNPISDLEVLSEIGLSLKDGVIFDRTPFESIQYALQRDS